MTDPFFDHDRLDVYRLATEYDYEHEHERRAEREPAPCTGAALPAVVEWTITLPGPATLDILDN